VRWTALLVAVPLAGGCKSAPGPVRGDDGVPREVAGPSPGAHGAREIVTFPSGTLTLHGVVYRPKREGASPAVLWNHGSYKEPMVAFDELGPAFAAHGWVFFGPFRRGQGLSADAGPYIDDEIDRANREGGSDAGARTMVRLLAGEHLDDQLAAYDWLRTRPFVAPSRIAVAGNSFGGIETVLGAARVPYCAAIDGAGAAQTWAKSADLRDLLLRSVRASWAPLFFFQAANDFDLAPSNTLAAAARDAGKLAELRIYPPFGSNHGQGHNFAWHGSAVWAADVLAFLDGHCP
jgi:dienelactone hydrolase